MVAGHGDAGVDPRRRALQARRAGEGGALLGAAADPFDRAVANGVLKSDSKVTIQEQNDNVIITPHMAGITEQSMMRMGIGAAEEALRVLANHLPVNLRNGEVLDRYRARFPADGG